ncbi:hypothetical protein JL49_25060, partial [Pseudoalteromonas luteoviolacea]
MTLIDKLLPQTVYQYTFVKKVHVHIDYHVEVEKHYYSVPYTLVKQKLEVHICSQQVKIYHHGKLVALHPRSSAEGSHTTNEQHMPIAHRKHQQWSPERLERWAAKIGKETETLVKRYLNERKHPEQSYRRCLGLLNL